MGKFLFYMLFLMFGPLLLYMEGPQIKDDYYLRSDTIIDADISSTGSYCRSKAIVVKMCTFMYRLDGESEEFDYTFLALRSPDTVVIQKGQQSGHLTTTVGQDFFWNRVVTVAIGFLISGFTFYAMISPLLFGRDDEDDDFGNPIPAQWRQSDPSRQADGYEPYASRAHNFGQQSPQGFGRRG